MLADWLPVSTKQMSIQATLLLQGAQRILFRGLAANQHEDTLERYYYHDSQQLCKKKVSLSSLFFLRPPIPDLYPISSQLLRSSFGATAKRNEVCMAKLGTNMMSTFDRPLLVRTASLLAGSFALGLVVNSMRPSGVALFAFEPPTVCTTANKQEGLITEMTPHEAMRLCGRPEIIFADTREHDRFAAGHVADAMHLPCNISASGAEIALKKLGNVQTVVLYGESTEDAREVADTLRRLGVDTEIRILRGGFAAWEQEGLACTSGPCKECSISDSKEKSP